MYRVVKLGQLTLSCRRRVLPASLDCIVQYAKLKLVLGAFKVIWTLKWIHNCGSRVQCSFKHDVILYAFIKVIR